MTVLPPSMQAGLRWTEDPMPYPDNFTWDRFERHHGPHPDRRPTREINDAVSRAFQLRRAAIAFLAAAKDARELDETPVKGWGVDEVFAVIEAVAAIDLPAYRAKLEEW